MFNIGVDPDAANHGIAIYYDGRLIDLKMLPLMQVYQLRLDEQFDGQIVRWHIEDVCANNAIFAKHLTPKPAANYAIARKVGKLQQACKDLTDLLEYFFPHDPQYFYPISRKWKDSNGKKEFMMATSWKERSNEDTRSAAYFGFLGCGQKFR